MKILIVDDNLGWRNFNYKLVLDLFGDNIKISLADSGEAGLQKAMENISEPFDIILSDLQMELTHVDEHAGEWMIREVKSLPQYINTKFIIISASPDINFVAESLNVDFLRKSNLVHNALFFKLKLEELKII